MNRRCGTLWLFVAVEVGVEACSRSPLGNNIPVVFNSQEFESASHFPSYPNHNDNIPIIFTTSLLSFTNPSSVKDTTAIRDNTSVLLASFPSKF